MIKARLVVRQDNTDKFERRVERAANLGASDLADELISHIRSHWSASSPSSPGNPPAIKSGNLDESIFKEKQGRDLLGRFSGKSAQVWFVRVDTTLGPYNTADYEYGARLEDAMDREFVEPAADAVMDRFGGSIRRRM